MRRPTLCRRLWPLLAAVLATVLATACHTNIGAAAAGEASRASTIAGYRIAGYRIAGYRIAGYRIAGYSIVGYSSGVLRPYADTQLLTIEAATLPAWKVQTLTETSTCRHVSATVGRPLQLLLATDRECRLEIPAMQAQVHGYPQRFQSTCFLPLRPGSFEMRLHDGDEVLRGELRVLQPEPEAPIHVSAQGAAQVLGEGWTARLPAGWQQTDTPFVWRSPDGTAGVSFQICDLRIWDSPHFADALRKSAEITLAPPLAGSSGLERRRVPASKSATAQPAGPGDASIYEFYNPGCRYYAGSRVIRRGNMAVFMSFHDFFCANPGDSSHAPRVWLASLQFTPQTDLAPPTGR